MSLLRIETVDDIYFVDSGSVHMVEKWDKKWLAGVSEDGDRIHFVSLDHVICVSDLEADE